MLRQVAANDNLLEVQRLQGELEEVVCQTQSAKQNDHHVSSLDKGKEEVQGSGGGEEIAHASDRRGDIQNGGRRFS